MNDQEFKQKLSQVAEWHFPEDKDRPYAKSTRKNNNESLELVDECTFNEITEQQGPNTTLPPVITKIKYQSEICDDCGRRCENGRKKEKKIYTTGQRHWREKCVTCKRFKNPITGEYNITDLQSTSFFSNLFKKVQGCNNSKYSELRKMVKNLVKD